MNKNLLLKQIAIESQKNVYLINKKGRYKSVVSSSIFDKNYMMPKAGDRIEDKNLMNILQLFIKSKSDRECYYYNLVVCGKTVSCKAVLMNCKKYFFSKPLVIWTEAIVKDDEIAENMNIQVLNIMLKSKYLHFIIVDKEMKFVKFNELFKEYLLRKKGILLKEGDDFRKIFSPDKLLSYIKIIETVKRTNTQFFFETEFNECGESESFQVILDPIADEYGVVKFVMISGYNISDLKNAKRRLYEERERLSVTLKSIGEGVIVTDIDNQIIYFNSTASKITAYQDTEAVSKKLDEIFVVKEADLSELSFISENGNRGKISLLTKSDGTNVYIEYTQTTITDNDGTDRGQILVFKDITERLRLEHEILKNSKLESLGLLAGGLAHDYNNLLTAILGNITLSKIFSDNPEVTDTLKQAEIAANKASELTQKLITFSKGGSPIKTTIQLNDFLNEIVSLYLTGSNIKPRFEITSGVRKITGDKDQLTQALSNIIINAKQSMPEGGELLIKTSEVDSTTDKTLMHETGKFIKIEISDNGIGISKNIMTKIFDPYFTTKENATGLGLSTTYSIIKRHNGYIHAENSKNSKGAAFIVYLPLDDNDELQPEPKKCTAASGKELDMNILVMDDDPIIRTTLLSMLKQLSCKVALAEDGNEAVSIYKDTLKRNDDFDVIMLDLTVPGGMGGKQAVLKLKELNPKAKCIVTSGYYDDPVMASWKEYGFSGVLKKPYTLDILSDFLSGFVN